eukprot:TRINITY_DN18608_c0_g1_i1.p1 TRINITY_DN18608_c0_g1~~TRINITY_DN18608_c0_g1_i1.p1  ORF type:complete len:165 (+),score=18.54 TRINITY_DN18608_c0_g1_i1:36-497(+)
MTTSPWITCPKHPSNYNACTIFWHPLLSASSVTGYLLSAKREGAGRHGKALLLLLELLEGRLLLGGKHHHLLDGAGATQLGHRHVVAQGGAAASAASAASVASASCWRYTSSCCASGSSRLECGDAALARFCSMDVSLFARLGVNLDGQYLGQ